MISHMEYLSPCVETMGLVCILNVVRSTVFVVTFFLYPIQFTPTVRRTRIGYYFCGCTTTTMHYYVAVRPNGIFFHTKKLIVFIIFFAFTGNPSTSRPNYFYNPFCQRSLNFL